MEFSLCDTKIDSSLLASRLKTPASGAVNIFEGIVRNHNNQHAVHRLFYEAYPELCETEIENIFREVQSLYQPHRVICQHRVGALEIGDTAVWIGVSSAHRDASFKACRYLIDEIKSRLPIWKKETYSSGESGWINCAQPMDRINPEIYYSRQMLLPDVGSGGQDVLARSKVLVVGAGGLGSAALLGLAGSGIGTIGIAEFDHLEEHNLHRQHIYAHAQVGQPKLRLAAQRILELNPSLQVISHPEKLSPKNVESIITAYDVILDCTDNFATKFLLNDAAVLFRKPLIQASLYQNDAQLRYYVPEETACLRCTWPEMPEAGCIGTCQDTGVLGDVAATMGHLQSLSTVQLLLGTLKNADQTTLMDFSQRSIQTIRNTINPDCPICGPKARIKSIEFPDDADKSPLATDIRDLSDETLLKATLIDVRESYERVMSPLKETPSIHLPCSRFDPQSFKMPTTESTAYFFCAKGIRSLAVVESLASLGFENVISLNNTFAQIRSRFQAIEKSMHSNSD